MASKQNALCLADKMKVIEYAKQNPSAGTRKIADVFECGRTQIQTILKNQESITHIYKMNAPATRKRLRGPQYKDIDTSVYDWYTLARQRLVPVTGPMLQEEALVIASSSGINDFKASNGWLQRFKDQNNIKQLVVSSESGDVRRPSLLGERGLLHLCVAIPQRILYETRTKLVPSFKLCQTKLWLMPKRLAKEEKRQRFASLWHSL